jgi:hypothetical protein
MYKGCPEIPFGEISLSDISGNPVADTASEEKIAPTSRGFQMARQLNFHIREQRGSGNTALDKNKNAAGN